MILRAATACLLVLTTFATVAAQFSKTMHSSFPTEGIERIDIGLVDNITVETWVGNTILVQTDVRLFNANKALFAFLTGPDGRYEVKASVEGTALNLINVEPSRAQLQTGRGACREEINVKVLLPATFVGEGVGPYLLQTEEPGS